MKNSIIKEYKEYDPIKKKYTQDQHQNVNSCYH